MKTYNLGAGSFWIKRDGETCHCALGVLMAERGYEPDEIIHRGWVVVRDDLLDDVAAMAEAMRPALPEEWHDRDAVDQVYSVNDSSVSDDGWKTYVPRFPLDVIQSALKAAGIEVELVDKRSPHDHS